MPRTAGAASGVSESSPSITVRSAASAAAAAASVPPAASMEGNDEEDDEEDDDDDDDDDDGSDSADSDDDDEHDEDYHLSESESDAEAFTPKSNRLRRQLQGRDDPAAATTAASSSSVSPSPLLAPLTVRAASPPTHEAARAFSEAGFDAVMQTEDSLRKLLLDTHAKYADEYAILEPLLLSKLVVYQRDSDRLEEFLKAHPVLKIDGQPAPGLHLWQSGSQLKCGYTTLFTCNTCTNRVPSQKDIVIGSIVADHGTEAQKQALKALIARKYNLFVVDIQKEKLRRMTDRRSTRKKRRRASSANESSDEAAAASTSSKHRRTSSEKQQAAPPHDDDDDDDEEDQDRDEVDEDGEDGDQSEDDPTSRLALAAQRREGGYLFDGVWYRLPDPLGPRQEDAQLQRRGYMRLKPAMDDLVGAPDAERILPFLTRMKKRRDPAAAAAAAAIPEVGDESNSVTLSPAEVGDAETLYRCKACSFIAARMPDWLLEWYDRPRDLDCIYSQPMSSALLEHIRRDHAHLTPPKNLSPELVQRLHQCKQRLIKALQQPQARHFDHVVCEADFVGSKAEKSAALKEYLTTLKGEYQSEPIDLFTVLQRVIVRCYSSIDEVVADAQRVFDNAKQYNEEESDIYQAADELEAELMPKLEEIAQRKQEEEECNNQPPAAEANSAEPTADDAPATSTSEAGDEPNEPFGMEIDSSPSAADAASSNPLAAAASSAPPIPVPALLSVPGSAAASSSSVPPSPLLAPLTVPSVAASPPTHEAARKLGEVGFTAVTQTKESLRKLLDTFARYADEYAVLEPLLLSKLVVYTADRKRRNAFHIRVDCSPAFASTLHKWQSVVQLRNLSTIYTCDTCTNHVPTQKSKAIEWLVTDHGTEAQKQAWAELRAKMPQKARKPRPAQQKRRRAAVAAAEEESDDESAAASASKKHRRISNEQQAASSIAAAAAAVNEDDDDVPDRLALATKKRDGGYLSENVWYRLATDPQTPQQEVKELERRGYNSVEATVDDLGGASGAKKILPFLAKMTRQHDVSPAAAAAAPPRLKASKSFVLSPAEVGDAESLFGCKACSLVASQLSDHVVRTLTYPRDVDCVYFQPISSALLNHIRRDHAHLSAPKNISRELDQCKQAILDAFMQPQARHFDHAVRVTDFNGLGLSAAEKSAMLEDYTATLEQEYQSEPIDLLIVLQRVILRCYSSVDEVVADAQRVFDNAKHYNKEESDIYQAAVELEAELMPRLRGTAEEYEKQKDKESGGKVHRPTEKTKEQAQEQAPAVASSDSDSEIHYPSSSEEEEADEDSEELSTEEVEAQEPAEVAPAPAADSGAAIPSEAVDEANEPIGMEIDSSPSAAAAASSNPPAAAASSAPLAPASSPPIPASASATPASAPPIPVLADATHPLGALTPLVDRINSEVTKCIDNERKQCAAKIRALEAAHAAETHALREKVRARDETIRQLREKARTFDESTSAPPAQGAHDAKMRAFHAERRALDEAHAAEIRRLRESHDAERRNSESLERANAYLRTRLAEFTSKLAAATTATKPDERKENGVPTS